MVERTNSCKLFSDYDIFKCIVARDLDSILAPTRLHATICNFSPREADSLTDLCGHQAHIQCTPHTQAKMLIKTMTYQSMYVEFGYVDEIFIIRLFDIRQISKHIY